LVRHNFGNGLHASRLLRCEGTDGDVGVLRNIISTFLL
jgi:hypothetical protein